MWEEECLLVQILVDAINDFIGRYLIIKGNQNMTERRLRDKVGQGGKE